MVKNKDIETLKKKLNELETQSQQQAQCFFAYLSCIAELLVEKGIVPDEEFSKRLKKHKTAFKKIAMSAEFYKIMQGLKKKSR